MSESTNPKSPQKIPIPHASDNISNLQFKIYFVTIYIYSYQLYNYDSYLLGVCPKRLPLQELTNELQNRGIDYETQDKRQKLVEILDKKLTEKTLENKSNYIPL